MSRDSRSRALSVVGLSIGISFGAVPLRSAEVAKQTAPALTVRADRPEALYQRGEHVTFIVELQQDGRLHPEDVPVQWFLTKDGGVQLSEGKAILKGGRGSVIGSLHEPGFLQCRVVFQHRDTTSSALGAAGIDPLQIKPSLPVPEDFAAFWAGQKQKLAAIPINPRLTSVSSTVAGVEAFDVQADAVGAPVSGYFARPQGARPKSLPAVITLHSASGLQSSFLTSAVDWAREGVLALDMNPHGLPNGQPKEFYTQAGRGELSGFRSRGHESRETNYFRGMFLRVVRGIDFLSSQPEWDGRTVVLAGSSMGGAQALAGAGLDERVSFVAVNMPAMSDHAGVLLGRASVWPRYLKAPPAQNADEKVQALGYYDVANFAARARAEAYFNVGFIDTACPPTAVYAAYNSVRGAKRISHDITLGHVQTPVVREAIRTSVRQHIAAQRDPSARPDVPRQTRIESDVNGHIHPALGLTKTGTLVAVYCKNEFKPYLISRSADRGQTWTNPELFPPAAGSDVYPGSLTTLADGRLVHAWNVWFQTEPKSKSRYVAYSISSDDGRTWSPAKSLPRSREPRVAGGGGNSGHSVIRHPIVELAPNRWLLPLSDRTVTYNPESGEEIPFGDQRNHGQVPIVRTAKGTLVSGKGIRSMDGGLTWHESKAMPDLHSDGWRFEMVALQNGLVFLTQIEGPGTGGEKIHFVVSRDDGRSWEVEHPVEFYNPGRAIGGRSCPRTVELDAQTLGTIFFDTSANQPGGSGVFFRTFPTSRLARPE